jgi:hypothetical protein
MFVTESATKLRIQIRLTKQEWDNLENYATANCYRTVPELVHRIVEDWYRDKMNVQDWFSHDKK